MIVDMGVAGVGGTAAGPPPAMADVPDLPPVAGEVLIWAATGMPGQGPAVCACKPLAFTIHSRARSACCGRRGSSSVEGQA